MRSFKQEDAQDGRTSQGVSGILHKLSDPFLRCSSNLSNTYLRKIWQNARLHFANFIIHFLSGRIFDELSFLCCKFEAPWLRCSSHSNLYPLHPAIVILTLLLHTFSIALSVVTNPVMNERSILPITCPHVGPSSIPNPKRSFERVKP
jgi:hypothetical protein